MNCYRLYTHFRRYSRFLKGFLSLFSEDKCQGAFPCSPSINLITTQHLTTSNLCARAHHSTQSGAVNGSRARALAARTPNLRRSPARLLNFSPALQTSPGLFFMSVVQSFLFQARMYHQLVFLKAVPPLRWYISSE